MIIVKKSHTNQSLLIAIDLCKVDYQTLLIIYLKLTKNNVHLLDLKMIDYIMNARNVEKDVLSQKTD